MRKKMENNKMTLETYLSDISLTVSDVGSLLEEISAKLPPKPKKPPTNSGLTPKRETHCVHFDSAEDIENNVLCFYSIKLIKRLEIMFKLTFQKRCKVFSKYAKHNPNLEVSCDPATNLVSVETTGIPLVSKLMSLNYCGEKDFEAYIEYQEGLRNK